MPSKKITKREAKRLSILKWKWFYDNPLLPLFECPHWHELEPLFSECGLCEYNKGAEIAMCEKCILTPNCDDEKSLYIKWSYAKTIKTKKKYAGLILEAIKEW
jgi:hypothetical protein